MSSCNEKDSDSPAPETKIGECQIISDADNVHIKHNDKGQCTVF